LRTIKKIAYPFFFIGMMLSGSVVSDVVAIEKYISTESTADLPVIKERKYLRALVTYSRTEFTILPDGSPAGVQVELLSNFEKLLNKGIKKDVDKTKVIFIPTTYDKIFDDLVNGKGDIAATLLTATPEKRKQVDFVTDGVMVVNEILVTHKGVKNIKKLDDLSGRKIHVLPNSNYAEHLRELNADFVSRGLKPIRIIEVNSHLVTEDLLEMVNAGVIEATVVNDFIVKLWASVLSNIRLSEDIIIKSTTEIGWAIRKNNPQLLKALKAFRKTVKKGTLLGNMLFKRYFKNTKWIKNPIAESERSKFRRVIGVFEHYAGLYNFDVLATVAQAYQESGLDHSKKSHRGAVGIMQILPATAADPNINIQKIDKLENNIHAGVKYLSFIRDRYFSDPSIADEEKLAFCWAAYNAGPAKVRKMRRKAKEMGLDENVWFGNVEMAAAKIVGNETVNYVRNIFKYYIVYKLIRDKLKDKDLV
jgi:membrane-bound lytic murein transglycosylase MltF